MKKLRAKGVVVLVFPIMIMLMILMLGVCIAYSHSMKELVASGVILELMPLTVMIYGYRLYQRHWICYGDDKLIIRRENKKIENGKPTGKWKISEDEISLRDIKWYGYLMFEKIEYLRAGNSRFQIQFCIELKNGEKIGFVSSYYTRWQQQELCDYIEQNTGILAETRNQWTLTTNKTSKS